MLYKKEVEISSDSVKFHEEQQLQDSLIKWIDTENKNKQWKSIYCLT